MFMSVIGIDLGGTKLAAALFDRNGRILEKKNVPLAGRTGRDVGALIVGLARDLCRGTGINEISGLGVCVPGIYYARQGSVWAPNVPEWENYPLLQELQQAFSDSRLFICIDSDRACYILGETWQGAAQGCENAIFLAVGTGIGAGILMDGRVLRGHRDIAGAVGWMALTDEFRDPYAACGCFEYHASGHGLAKVARDYLAQDTAYNGVLRPLEPAAITAADLFSAYDRDDPIARRVLDEAVVIWGKAVANMVSAFNPEKIIFGGGVFGPAARFLDRIHAEAKKWAQPISFAQVQLAVSTLGSDAGLIGAGKLALG